MVASAPRVLNSIIGIGFGRQLRNALEAQATVRTDFRPSSHRYYFFGLAVMILLLPQQGAAFKLEANHVFEGEARVSSSSTSLLHCSFYENTPARIQAALFSRAAESWRPAARRPEHMSWLYGTAFAQEIIQRHQFRSPEGCARARFLGLKHGRSAGIGCWMHLLAKAMALAMRNGRILVLLDTQADPNMIWYQRDLCPNAHSWECWFHPITNCTPHGDIFQLNPTDLLHDENGYETEYTSAQAPRVFHRMLRDCSGIKRNLWFYWWHAQWVAFFVRFNPSTRRLLDYLRRQKLKLMGPGLFARGDKVHFWNPKSRKLDQEGVIRRVLAVQMGDLAPGSIRIGPADGSSARWVKAEDIPFTILRPQSLQAVEELPRGSVAVHVRHGDKIIEMELLELGQYVEQAERLAEGDQTIPVLEPDIASSARTIPFPQRAFRGRTLFVSTEDPHVISEALALTWRDENPWSIAFSQENRTNDILLDALIRKSPGKLTLESFLNLEVALEADAWICTLQSNWCQLIDELRMTIGGKTSFPYINLRSQLNAAFKEVRNSYVYW